MKSHPSAPASPIRRTLANPLSAAFTCAILLLCPAALVAQSPELITDRPDQTESAAVVPRGRVLIEAGFLESRSSSDGTMVRVEEAPGTLIRVGLGQNLELRLGWAGEISETIESRQQPNRRATGSGDADVGFKLKFSEEKGRRPEIALLVSSSVPIGTEAFTTDRYDPAFRLSLAHTLTERLSLGYNLGFEWETEGVGADRSTLSRGIYTVALGIGLSERFGAYVELFGDVAGSARGGPAHSANGGFTFLLRPNLQFDATVGLGLIDRADDEFFGFGVSVLLPG